MPPSLTRLPVIRPTHQKAAPAFSTNVALDQGKAEPRWLGS